MSECQTDMGISTTLRLISAPRRYGLVAGFRDDDEDAISIMRYH